MAFGSTTISDFGSAAGDLLQGQATQESDQLKAQGDIVEGQNYTLAAALAGQNEEFAVQSTAVQEAQTQRKIYQAEGATAAEVGGAGFANSGSALDIMRSNVQQGSLNKQIVGQQGLINEAGYAEQQTAYTNLAGYANYAAGVENNMASNAVTDSFITGGFKAAAGLATLF